jgi:hypothetical protein
VTYKLPPGFTYNRIPPREWQDQLAAIAPRGEIAPWLHLAWLSGDPWEPVQRWCVYEMVPIRVWQGLIQAQRARGFKPEETLEQLILDGLMGPNPRELGHYDTVLGRFITEADVTRQEWELFRELRAIPKLFWIVQGHHGGHRRHFTPMEKKYLQLAGLPPDPPAPGELPYVDFDNRALEMIRRRDRLQRQSGFLGANEDEYSAAMVEFRRQLVQWLEDQQHANLESAKLDLSDLPTSGDKVDDPTEAIERRTERFIQTGSIYPKAKD